MNDDELIIDDDFESGEQDSDDGQVVQQQDDFVDSLLKSRGIQDSSKIKFENEDGTVDDVDWKDLSNEERLAIINAPDNDEDSYGLDDDEINLINTIRNSRMSPNEYIQSIQLDSVNRYVKNNSPVPEYNVDSYSDDELFIADFMSRYGDNVTEEEAQEALTNAKLNEVSYKKLIGAIRDEYRTIEREQAQQAQVEQEQIAEQQYKDFTNQIANEIGNFTLFSGYDLNMSNEDMQELYEFITGTDGAGNNYFTKALQDPKTLVRMAWFALNGENMVQGITNYFQREIAKSRQGSRKNNSDKLVVKDKNNKGSYIDPEDF